MLGLGLGLFLRVGVLSVCIHFACQHNLYSEL
jgi:hypothetical protein